MTDVSEKPLRVFLCGCHSTGKSSTLESLRRHLNIHLQPEVARVMMREAGVSHAGPDFKVDPDTYLDFQRTLMARQFEVEELLEGKDYVMDRGIDPVVYCQTYVGPQTAQRLINDEITQRCIRRYRESLIFVFSPKEECLEKDGVREDPTMPELLRFTECMYDVMDSQGIPYHVISVLDREERVNIVLEKIRQWKPSVIKST